MSYQHQNLEMLVIPAQCLPFSPPDRLSPETYKISEGKAEYL